MGSAPIVRRVAARVGLVGNPSDGYGGAVLAAVLPGPAAEVTAAAADGVDLGGERWPTLAAWSRAVAEHGHAGERRLLSASLWVVVEHLRARGQQPGPGVALRWGTEIPRSVGLAGSSALAVATIEAVAAAWHADLGPRTVAALALRAERDVLGIAAGWQDRIAQAHGCTVLVDAAEMDREAGHAVPRVATPRWPGEREVELLVAWSPTSADDSSAYHAPLQRRSAELAGPMGELASLARHAAAAWSRGDAGALAAAIDAGWQVRQRHVPLRADHAALVEAVRGAGLAATTPGSGGSVVACCSGATEAATSAAVAAARAVGAEVGRVAVR